MDSTSPLVSVIVPTYNRRAVLPRAVRSILEQTLQEAVEVIVVDDGSTDGTADMLKTDFPTVQCIRQANQGVSAARNTGLAAARGQWIALLDSDDHWLPQKLHSQLQALSAEPELRICHTEEIWIRNGRRVNPMKKHQKSGGWIYLKCLPLCCISPSSVVIHREVFDDVGLFDESLPACEDYDLWLRICAHEPVLFLDEPLTVKTGGHDDQLSRAFWGMDRFRVRALKKRLEQGKLSDSDRDATLAMLIGKLEILIQGAQKRSNTDLLHTYVPMLNHAKDLTGNAP